MFLSNELSSKIIIVGNSGVGKTCLLYNYTHNEFIQKHQLTVGLEFSTKTVKIDNQTDIKLQIWDTAGQESYQSLVRSFYRQAAGVFLVYSINDRDSFKNLEFYLKEARDNGLEGQIFVLIGTKSDKEKDRQVTHEEGIEFMQKNGLAFFFETSALNGSNIESAFNKTAKLIFLNFVANEMKRSHLFKSDVDIISLKKETIDGRFRKVCCFLK